MSSYALRRGLLVATFAVLAGFALDRGLQKVHAQHPPKLSAVLVTGASSGIGRAAALALHEYGFVVYAGVRDPSSAEQLRLHGPRLRPLVLDVTSAEQISAAYDTISSAAQSVGGGQLVAIVNNAGTTYKRPLETAELGQMRALFDANVFGALAVTQAFLPLLRRARGRVVNVGSVQGIISMPMHGPYAATKHALEALSDTLRQELGPLDVSVSMVNPGYVNTGIRTKGSAPESNASLTSIERQVYYSYFERAWRKDAELRELAPACCPETDAAILHAITSPTPRTRYYPATAAVRAGGLFPAWLAAVVIRALSVHPLLDRLKDLAIGHLF